MHLPPRALPRRIGFAFIILIVATWLAVGGALFVVLRGLHGSETQARLTDIVVPLTARLRTAVAAGQGVETVIADLEGQLAGTGVGVYAQLADGRVVGVGGSWGSLEGLSVDPSLARGDLEQGTYRAADGTTWAWSASILRAVNVRGARALIVATPDRSSADALGDLLKALPAVILLSLAVGIPIAIWLARSVTTPLRRLMVATDALATAPDGPDAPPLELEGPEEVQELTARFEGMRHELHDSRRREAELLADLRHDLRTPLTAIEGFAEALVDGTAKGPAADRAARAIVEEAHRIDALVDGLGDLERLRNGAALRPERLDARVMVEEAVARFTPAAHAAGVDLEAVPALPGLELTADRTAVQRILANLVANALAAVGSQGGTDAATPRHHVQVEVAPAADATTGRPGVMIAVTDDGPGFPPGTAERAFDRFYRADPARTGPGSGLGLAIVRELAVAHGGRAYAENLSPHGARVSVVLPVTPALTPPAGEIGA